MAESVDALVSNTSGATHPGSIPGLGTEERNRSFSLFLFSMYTAAQGHKGGGNVNSEGFKNAQTLICHIFLIFA